MLRRQGVRVLLCVCCCRWRNRTRWIQQAATRVRVRSFHPVHPTHLYTHPAVVARVEPVAQEEEQGPQEVSYREGAELADGRERQPRHGVHGGQDLCRHSHTPCASEEEEERGWLVLVYAWRLQSFPC